MSRFLGAFVACGLLVAGLGAGVAPTQAAQPLARASAPLTETEPNDTALQANGPIPAAGFIATRATPDDHDMFVLRLRAQRQVTMTLQRVSGCRESINSNPTTFDLTRSDGKSQFSFSNWSGSPTLTRSWTTPAVDAEYLGDIAGDYWWDGNQCTVSVTVSPADAVIEGPMPARPPRGAALTPVDIVTEKSFATTVTGNGYSGDTLYTWFASAGSSCTSAPYSAATTPVPAGPFTVPVTMTAGDAGYATVCMVLRNTEKTLIQESITAAPVAVRVVRPISLASTKVHLKERRRAALKLRCDLPAGDVCTTALTIRTKGGLRIADVTATIPSTESRRVSFKVSRTVAKKVKASGGLQLVALGTVTRTALGPVPTRKLRFLLLPPR